MLRTILVPLAPGLAGKAPLETAASLATPLGAQIRAVFVCPDPEASVPYFAVTLAGAEISRDAVDAQGREAAAIERSRFEAWRTGHAIPEKPPSSRPEGCSASWTERGGDIEHIVPRLGRVSDLILLGRFRLGETLAERCFEAAVFGSGRPTLLVPESLSGDLLRHVMVAWHGSLEASRAVFAALPLLAAAGRVSIFTVAEGEADQDRRGDRAEALPAPGFSPMPAMPPAEP